MSATRRQLLGRGLGAAAASALPASLLAADLALAQESEETDALAPLVELEQAAELAYSIAVEDAKLRRPVNEAFERFGAFAGDHGTALSEALDMLRVDPPEAQSDPAAYDALDDFNPNAPQARILAFMIGLEEQLVIAYEEASPQLESEDLVRTAAEIGASHAQVLVALRVLAGEPARLLLPEASTAASATGAGESSSAEEE